MATTAVSNSNESQVKNYTLDVSQTEIATSDFSSNSSFIGKAKSLWRKCVSDKCIFGFAGVFGIITLAGASLGVADDPEAKRSKISRVMVVMGLTGMILTLVVSHISFSCPRAGPVHWARKLIGKIS